MWSRATQHTLTQAELLAALAKAELLQLKWRSLNAFVTECWDQACKDVEILTSKSSVCSENNPLYGMPLAVKDNFCTQGMKTACASKMLDSFVPPYTCTVVDRLQNRGMIVVGKTSMDSFAMGSGGMDGTNLPTKNPWTWAAPQYQGKFSKESDTDFRIPGGSSGGSAVAVAADIVYGALGSDTGGSVRIPAAYCGVVGLKPTTGLLSRHGLIPLVNSLDCPGIITKTVEQCTNMLNAVAGHDPLDSTTYHSRPFKPVQLHHQDSISGLKIGIPQEYLTPDTSQEVIKVWQEVADKLESAGASVERISLSHLQYSIACYSVLNYCEVASNMARFDGIEYGHRAATDESTEALYAQTRHEAFNDVVRGRIFAGNYFLLKSNYEKFYLQAAKLRRLIYQDFEKAFSTVDVLLTPVALGVAPLHSSFSRLENRAQCAQQDVFTLPSNLAGVPAISVPIKLSQHNLPISLQLITNRFNEQTLLNTALFLESMCDFPNLSHYVQCDP